MSCDCHSSFPNTFVINLDSRIDRWKRISEACDRLRLPYTRVPAIQDEVGWIGCGKSHLKCISLAKEQRLPWVIIMEDDCEFDVDGIELLRRLLPRLWETRSKWERFSGGPHFGAGDLDPQIELYDRDYHLFYHRGFATHFDLIHEGAYDSVLRWEPSSCREIDTFYRDCAAASDITIRSICTYPFIARQGASRSDINPATSDWMPGLARYAESKLLETIEESSVDDDAFVNIRVRHPHWDGVLQLSKQGNVVHHKGTKDFGRYKFADGNLKVDWYRHPSEEFIRKGEIYVLNESRPEALIGGDARMDYVGLRTLQSVESPHLGGNIVEGDPYTFAPSVWDYLIKRFAIRSVLDLGAGMAFSSAYFYKAGLQVVAVDGLRENCVRSVYPCIQCDLTTSSVFCKVDLVHCQELVEHIEERYLENLLKSLSCGKYILMTNALPGQGGHHHVNEQPTEYWVEHLKRYSCELLPEDTKRIRELAENDGAIYLARTGLVLANRSR